MSLVCIFLFTSYLHNNNYSGQLSETQLAEKFSTASSTSLLSSSPSPPPPLTTAEEIETEIKADAGVVEELQGLESAFSRTLVKVKRFLELNKCDLSEAQLFLDVLTDTTDFSRCDNFDKLIRRLEQDYIDVFNISRLVELVACFERDELTMVVEAYEDKKQRFLQNTTVLRFQRAVVSRVEPVIPKGKAVVTIKIPKKLASKRTLKDIEELAMEGFEEGHKSLIRLHAVAGSVIISWIFPEALIGKLVQLAHGNAAVFKNAGVEDVTVGGRRVYPVSQEVRDPVVILCSESCMFIPFAVGYLNLLTWYV